MLKFLPLFFANLGRKPVRTSLTLGSIVVAFLLFGLLKTMEGALALGADLAGVDRLATATPTMLLGDFEPDIPALVSVFLDRPELRSRLAVCDLTRLERLGTVRSSAFVYLEWFLRDEYGVKLVPVPAFTQGLIDRGVISLGMG